MTNSRVTQGDKSNLLTRSSRQIETLVGDRGQAGCSMMAEPPVMSRAAKMSKDVSKSSDATNS